MSLLPSNSATANSFPRKAGSKGKISSTKLGRAQSSNNPTGKEQILLKPKTLNPFAKSESSQPNTEPSSPPNKVVLGTTSGAGEDSPNPNRGRNSAFPFTRLDVPSGFLPPGFKDCLLSNVVRSGRRSLDHLKEVRETLSNLVAEDDQLSKGIKKVNPSPDILQLAIVAEALTVLTREAFVPTHRLNQAAVALYSAEDFLRYPQDLRAFDATGSGRIKVPNANFNAETVKKLRDVVEKATEYSGSFNLKGQHGAELQDIMFTLMRAFQDLYTLMLGCQEVFKVLLYTSPREKANLQKFLLSLQSMERCDMLTEVQDLRRLTDELVIFLEKLSWGCFVVFRLASGKTIPPLKKLDSEEGAVGGGGQGQDSTKLKEDDHNMIPDLPFLQKDKGKKKSKTGKGKRPSSSRPKTDEGQKGVGNSKEFEMGQSNKKGKKGSGKGKKKNLKGTGSSDASIHAMTTPKSKKSKTKLKLTA